MAKQRLDLLLVARGLAPSRAVAASLILAGAVRLEGAEGRVLKAGQLVADDAQLSVAQPRRWASRGGEKLAHALDAFAVEVAGLVCLDAGASTGGFTDVLLAHGAARVYAVDVGRAQLVDRLRRDRRVVVMERTNLRTLASLPEPVQLATLDLSFISLELVLPAVHHLLADGGRVVALVKPQFEAGRDAVPRGGVVRDPGVHRAVLLAFADHARAAGFAPRGLVRSPIAGGDGNREFLALLDRDESATDGDWERRVESVLAVAAAEGAGDV